MRNKEKYKRIIRNTKNDAEFFVALEYILDDLNNKHVNVFSGYAYKIFYKTFYNYYSKYVDPYEYLSKYDIFSNPEVMHRYNFSGNIEKLEDTPINVSDSGLETKILIEDKVAYMKIENMGHSSSTEEERTQIKSFQKKLRIMKS